MKGKKVDIRGSDGILYKDVHEDLVVVIPEEVDDVEARQPVELEEPSRRGTLEDQRSPGQIIEESGTIGGATLSSRLPVPKGRRNVTRLDIGVHAAFVEDGPRRCRIGRSLN